MNKTIQLNGYEVTVTPTETTLKYKKGSVIVRPGEIGSLQQAIAAISGLQNIEVKPPYINFSPFKIHMDEDSFYIARQDSQENLLALEVKWGQSDMMVRMLDDLLNMAKDERKLRPGIRSGGWNPSEKGSVLG